LRNRRTTPHKPEAQAKETHFLACTSGGGPEWFSAGSEAAPRVGQSPDAGAGRRHPICTSMPLNRKKLAPRDAELFRAALVGGIGRAASRGGSLSRGQGKGVGYGRPDCR